MADSYGGDLRRWPEGLRDQAQELLHGSPEARAYMSDALALDAAIQSTRKYEDALLPRPGEQNAMLDRLRLGVGVRITSTSDHRQLPRPLSLDLAAWWQGVISLHLRGMGVVVAGGFAVIAGLLIGAIYVPTPASGMLLAILEPSPIHILVE
ncbi:MAG: hypothetical protein G3H99_01270 [Ferrovum sp.]|nr:hypothetical protein [Ferrovum sp.]